MTAAPAEVELYCPNCGYDLRALDGDVCPECGLHIDRATLGTSRIPWTHRARIGRARAYLRTVWLATAHGNELAQERARAVGYGDAQRFRWITVALTVLPVAAVLCGILAYLGGAELRGAAKLVVGSNWFGAPRPWVLDLLLPWIAGSSLPPVLPLALVLSVVFVSGVHTYWLHPGSLSVVRQNRAVALGYYAIAPMLWLPVPAIVLIGSVASFWAFESVWQRTMKRDEYQLAALVACVSLGVVVGLMWLITFNVLRLVKHVNEEHVPRTIAAAICIPLSWLACAVVALVGVPWVVGYAYLVVDSFR